MQSYRSNYEIILNILNIAGGRYKTNLQSKVGLNGSQKHLDNLLTDGLITIDDNGTYALSDRGKEIKEKLEDFFDDFGEDLEKFERGY